MQDRPFARHMSIVAHTTDNRAPRTRC
jgi:hypothetical protein